VYITEISIDLASFKEEIAKKIRKLNIKLKFCSCWLWRNHDVTGLTIIWTVHILEVWRWNNKSVLDDVTLNFDIFYYKNASINLFS